MGKIIVVPMFVLMFLFSCKTVQPVINEAITIDTTNCQFEITLLDYRQNSDCQFLFQLEDGTKLLASAMPLVDIPFFDGQKMIIGYRAYESEHTKTNVKCQIADKVVEITCIEKVEDKLAEVTSHEDCSEVKNLFLIMWMREAVTKIKPQKIFEYVYDPGFLYLFSKGDVSYLYDCLGNAMCSTDDGGDCSSLISTLGQGKLIQVLKN